MASQSEGFVTRFFSAWKKAAAGGIREKAEENESAALAAVAPAEPKDSDFQAKIASLAMDIEDRDRRIAQLKNEYGMLSRKACEDAKSAGEDGIVELAKRLAPLLSQSSAMRALHERGTEIGADDLFKILSKIEKTVFESGFEPIGSPGEEIAFDARYHQRMSGGGVSQGMTVKVRFPGCRRNDTVLLKALVSAKE